VLNEREVATAILLSSLLGAMMLHPKTRSAVRGGVAVIAKALWHGKVLGVLFAYFGWVALCVWGAHELGVWHPPLLKDTVLTAVVVGLPLLFHSLDNKTGVLLLRDVAKEAVGLTALVAFYVNVTPLPLWGELVLQPSIAFLIVSQFVLSRTDPRGGQRTGAGCVTTSLGLIGFGLLAWSTASLINNWLQSDPRGLFEQLAMSIWLPMALFPFLYSFAYLAAVEAILVRVSHLNRDVGWKEKLGIVVGLGFSLRSAKGFVGQHLRLNGPRTFRGAVDHARDVGHDLDRREAKRLDQLHSLDANSGLVGTDASGAQIDRREFYVTKQALEWLHTCQMGWYERQGNHFWGQERVDGILSASLIKALPEPHSIVLDTDESRTRWRGWRRLPNGWVLGIGGTTRSDKFLYSAQTPPSSFPGEAAEWIDASLAAWPVDWDRNDALQD
jgi:hypothetical protein